MKEALVTKGPEVQVVDSPVPSPNDDQVLIRVVVSGSNPKDWKMAEWFRKAPSNEGDDIAGVVERVGANVFEFKPGDRVAAFHEMATPHGSYAEYAVAWAHTTFHIPHETTFEEAAALPLAAMTAAVGLYARLGLPQPLAPRPDDAPPLPLIIYGASSAVGIYAVQLARRSNIHPLICVAGRARDYVSGFLDKARGDVVVDYRDGDDAVVAGILLAAGDKKLMYALDAVSEGSSPANLARVLDAGGGAQATFVLYGRQDLPAHIVQNVTTVGSVHKDLKDFGHVYYRYFARGLQEGWFKGQRTQVMPGGLGGIEAALKDLKAGNASAVKYVFRIAETEGVVGSREGE
ncbi:chaperonin 10-like protein [Lasiosphaeria miniovina]|uniref:Chaperonin 10-like protein n=1 Tax=Lasiosphaeria miniovina TaxID=1954250 RepID=A0AA40DSL7_9PEZI|nr:chaperonin 10-like protein [Lasiosphaeria miniovina]KAK0713990.1 chaperonin 10-like protein [Lasiosphaeria miniovina]